jgi:hypothetical protein
MHVSKRRREFLRAPHSIVYGGGFRVLCSNVEIRISKSSGRYRSKGENVVPTGGGHFHRAFHMLLAFDLAEIKFLFAGSCLGPTIGRAKRFERNISAQKIHHLRKRTRNELLEMAEVTRSLLSLTAVTGNPTTAILSEFPQPLVSGAGLGIPRIIRLPAGSGAHLRWTDIWLPI